MRLVSSVEYSLVPEAASLVLRTSRCTSERSKTHHNRNSYVKSEHGALSELQRPRRPRPAPETVKRAQDTVQKPEARLDSWLQHQVAGMAGEASPLPDIDPPLQLAQQLADLPARQPVTDVLEGWTLQRKQIMRVLSYLDKWGHRHKALRAFEWMQQHDGEQHVFDTQDTFLYTRLMTMFSRRSSDCSQALHIFDSMQSRGIKPDLIAYNTAINAAGKSGDWERTVQIFEALQDSTLKADVWTFTSLINACQSCGNDWKSGIEVFQDMEAQGIEPNVHAYTSLISLCQRANQWRKAMQIFRRMEAADVKVDVVAYNSAIAACAKGGDWEQAWAVFSSAYLLIILTQGAHMHQKHASVGQLRGCGMRRAGVQPNTVSYNSLLSACERCGQAERALEVFNMMEKEAGPTFGYTGSSLVTYNTLISACGKAGMYDQVQKMFQEMQDRGIPGDVFTMCGMITACEKVGLWQEAQEVMQRLQQDGVQPNTVAYNALIKALGSGGQWEAAVSVFETMQSCAAEEPACSCNPDLVTYSSIISACQKSQQWQKALDVYEGMRAANVQPNAYVFSSLIAACEDNNEWEHALAVFGDMKASNIELDAVTMAGRKLVYMFPGVLSAVPGPLVNAAKIAVKSGRAARQWISPS